MIEEGHGRHSVRAMCEALGVAASAYYAWRSRPESRKQQADRRLLVEIRAVHAVVRLAAAVVEGRYTLPPDRSALVVVAAAYLTEPALSERWFGYSLSEPEAVAFECGESVA